MRGALRRGGSGRGRRGGFVEEAGAFLFLAEERAGRRASQEAGRKREGRMSHQNDVPSLVFLVVGEEIGFLLPVTPSPYVLGVLCLRASSLPCPLQVLP